MKTLKVLAELDFPLDAVTQKFAWLGRSGSGKTHGCKRFVEQMLHAGAQVIVLDTVGVWYGLRQGERGFKIPVLGGLHGDIPLEERSGELVAEAAVNHGASMVVDVSHFTDAAKARFAEAFGRRLFELKKQAPGPVHIVIDEAQDIVPQNPNANENMMLHHWVRIAKQGRNFGIGVSASSQRPQEVSKKFLNQTECVMAFQITGPQERKALEYWLADKGVDARELAVRLTTLPVGMPYVWSPQWLQVAATFGKVLPIESDDTSQTPKVGDTPRVAKKMVPVDLGALRASMEKATEEATVNDPNALREELKKLRLQLAEQRVLAAVLPEAVLVNLNKAQGALKEVADQSLLADGWLQAIWLNINAPASVQKPLIKEEKEPVKPSDGAPLNPSGIPTGELAVLRAIATRPKGCTVTLATLLTDLRSASVNSYMQRLSARGFITRSGGKAICTQDGLTAAAPVPKKRKGLDLVKDQLRSLPSGESRVLSEILASHPSKIDATTLATNTKLSPASVNSYLQRLSTREIITRRQGLAGLSPEVFE